MATINTTAGKFFRDFKAFARDAESSCRDFKTNLERPPLTEQEGGNSAQVLIENLTMQIDELTEEIDRVVNFQGFNSNTSHLSLESLYACTLAAYEKNEELKEDLEIKLEQYSYQRKDSTKQKTALQPSKNSVPSKNSSKASNIPKPNLTSSNSTTTISNTSTKPLPNHEEPFKPIEVPKNSAPSPPHTPPRDTNSTSSSNLFDDFPRTPTLEDVGISASALELIAKDQVKKTKKTSITNIKDTSQPDFTSIPKTTTSTANILSYDSIPTTLNNNHTNNNNDSNNILQERVVEKRHSNTSTSSGSRSSMEDTGESNFISERRRVKSKKPRGGKASLFPLMEEIRVEEYNGITPEYLKHSFSLEQLNKAVNKINEHMTDKRFSMEDDFSEGSLESFTEADLRDDLEFGVKAKGLVLLLIHLKRIALDKRFGGTRLTILEKQEKPQ